MPIYKVEQKGVPGMRLVEAPRQDSALRHVVEDAFTVEQVDGRTLLDAAKAVNYNIEVAGAPRTAAKPDTETKGDTADAKEEGGEAPGNIEVPFEPDADGDQPVAEGFDPETGEIDDRPLHERMAAQD